MSTLATAHPPIDEALPGDWLELEGSPAGAPPRRGQIVEVLGHSGHLHFRVRWDERHESIVYPERDGAIIHRSGSGRR